MKKTPLTLEAHRILVNPEPIGGIFSLSRALSLVLIRSASCSVVDWRVVPLLEAELKSTICFWSRDIRMSEILVKITALTGFRRAIHHHLALRWSI